MTAPAQGVALAIGNIAFVAICFALLTWRLTCAG